MNIQDIIQDSSTDWKREPPADSTTLQHLISEANFELPEDYLTFLSQCNGGEGELGIEPGWFSIWYVEEVIDLNNGYGVSEFIPGFFGFGSNGGGELIAFDTRTPQPWKIYEIPFIPMEESEAILIADSFIEFASKTGKEYTE